MPESMKPEKAPNVVVLKPITPNLASARGEVLEYDNLQSAVAKHAPHEQQRIREFWDTEDGSLEEQQAARQLAMQYMLMGAQALQLAVIPENRQRWSDRYTQATSEIYGTPDADLARELFEARRQGIEFERPFEDAAEKLGEYLDRKYADAYRALDIENTSEQITPNGIADRFEAAIKVMAEQHDSAWSDWAVERNEDKDSLSVTAGGKKVVVGMQRASVTPEQLKALFSHEVLVHGLRAVNGEKLDSKLQTGLPDYLDAEEGLGVFVEYAVSGKISEKNIDRYVDIAYALGVVDGAPHSRAELLELALQRAQRRNEAAEHKKSQEDIEKEVYAHVNRIYRGSRGDEHVGVFTKDISYHKGFIDMGRYISDQLDSGQSIDDVMDYMLLGKFDPTNQAHVDFVAERS